MFMDIKLLCASRQVYEVALKSVIELNDLMKHLRFLTGSSIQVDSSSHQIFFFANYYKKIK